MHTRILFCLLIGTLLLVVTACGSSAAPATPSASQSSAAPQASAPPATTADAPAAEPAAPAQTEPGGTPGLSSRVSDSVNKLLLPEEKQLDSYRIDMSGVEPTIDIMDNTLIGKKYQRQIEIDGDNVHMISNLEEKGEKTTREGYIIGGRNVDTMKDYEVNDGKLEDGGGMVGMGFAMFPLSVGMPVIMGGQGAVLQGEETIAGRMAEKYAIDSANIPKEALDFAGFKSIKGTAWIDKETGVLLKLLLDYEQEFVDPDPNSTKVLGVGTGRIDLEVSQIGQTKVTLPQ
jgi:hypothetical protein